MLNLKSKLFPSSGAKGKRVITWFTPSSSQSYDAQLASVWIRALQLFPSLRAMGYECFLNRISPKPDYAVFLRRTSSDDLKLALRLQAAGTRIISDVIVNYFSEYPSVEGSGKGCTQEQYSDFMRMIEVSDAVWCVSPFLADLAKKNHPNVFFISDSVDRRHFRFRKSYPYKLTRPLRVGWAGVSVKAIHLNSLRSSLRVGAELHVISDNPPKLDIPYKYKKWNYSDFPEDIVNCDICVSPRIVDNDYDRGHSIAKIGFFMAEGVPALASPVPSYGLLLGDGKGGGICDSIENLNLKIELCKNNPDVLKKWSNEAYDLMTPYCTETIARLVHERLTALQ